MCRFFPILSLLVMVAAGLQAQEAPTKAEITKAVTDLGAGSYQVRQQAQALLKRAGWDAREELAVAAKNRDPEVGDVARKLLADVLPGVTGATPDKLRNLVRYYLDTSEEYSRQSCLETIIAEGPSARAVLFALLDSENQDKARERIRQRMLANRRALFADQFAVGDYSGFEQLLQICIKAGDEAAVAPIVSYAFHRGRLAETRAQLADQLAKGNPRLFDQRLAMVLALAAGDEAEALRLAKETDNPPVLRSILILTCRWKELAELLVETMGAPSGRDMMLLAAAQRLAGQDELALKTLTALAGKDAEATDGLDGIEWERHGGRALWAGDQQIPIQAARWGRMSMPMGIHGSSRAKPSHYLAAFGLAEQALAAAKADGDLGVALKVLLGQCRYAEADRLLRDKIEKSEPPESWHLTIRRAHILQRLGDEGARGMVEGVLRSCLSGEGVAADVNVASSVVLAATQLFPDEASAAIPDLMTRLDGKSATQAEELAVRFAPQHVNQARALWKELAARSPEKPLASRATLLRKLLRGELGTEETDAILNDMLRSADGAAGKSQALVLVGQLCSHLGRETDAIAALRLAVKCLESGSDPRPLSIPRTALATALESYGRWAEAADEWQAMASEANSVQPVLNEAVCTRFAGDDERAEELLKDLFVVSHDSELRWSARLLDEAGWEQPIQRFLPLLTAYSETVTDETMDAVRDAGDYVLERKLAERRWFAQVGSPGSDPIRAMDVNARLAFAGCRVMIGEGKVDDALELAKRLSDAFPFQSDHVADTVAAFDRCGAKAQGDALTAHLLASERAMLDKLPNAGQHLNGYAWVCARTGRDLAEGEKLVRQAIEQMPDWTACIDTLAVILHRKGDLDGAIEQARRCVELDPDDVHFRYQLGRWQREKREKR